MENTTHNTDNIEPIQDISTPKGEQDKIQDENLKANTEPSNIEVGKVEVDKGEQILKELEEEPKTHTQTEINEIINKRFAKVSSKHRDEIQDLEHKHSEELKVLSLQFKALEQEYQSYKLDVEFQEEQKQLKKLGISKEAIDSLKAVKSTGDTKTYDVLRTALITPCLKGKVPIVSTGNKVTTKKISFLD